MHVSGVCQINHFTQLHPLVKSFTCKIFLNQDIQNTNRNCIEQVDYSVVPADLQHLFEKCGEIVRVKILVDKMSRPKGYVSLNNAHERDSGNLLDNEC